MFTVEFINIFRMSVVSDPVALDAAALAGRCRTPMLFGVSADYF
jgi:hypothetical protein